MWLVLTDDADPCGPWAVEALRSRGLAPVDLVTGDALAPSLCWAHRLGRSGSTVDIKLADGRVIRSAAVRGVLNRLSVVPLWALDRGPVEDREYAASELYAFFLGWLRTLEPAILNPATPRGLCGEWRHFSEWTLLAAQAGLPVQEFRRVCEPAEEPLAEVRPIRRAIVVARQVVAAAPLAGVEEGCLRLSWLAGTPILDVSFEFKDGLGPTFAGASPLPDLQAGGTAVADALAAALLAARLDPS